MLLHAAQVPTSVSFKEAAALCMAEASCTTSIIVYSSHFTAFGTEIHKFAW